MQYSAAERAIIWLCACTDWDYRERAALLRAAKSPENLLLADDEFFRSVIKPTQTGVYKKGRRAREDELGAFLLSEKEKGRFAVTLLSDGYPKLLSHIPDPPLALFCAGRVGLLQQRTFCIVGSRLLPAWAEKTGKLIAERLSERFAIVTGLAEGGDGAAISGALPSKNLICVLPNGLDECYPAAHASLKARIERAGLLVSEYPPAETVKKYSFYARNRLLAGLSEGVLVLAAGKRSGALITANFALEYGRDVFALPHNLGVSQGEGCNGLIKAGAYLTEGAEDIYSVYGIQAQPRERAALSSEEERVLGALLEGGELHAQEIALRAGVKVYEAAAILSALELKNLAVKTGGNKYAAVTIKS